MSTHLHTGLWKDRTLYGASFAAGELNAADLAG